VSTEIELVPWPLLMVPAETVQLKVGVTFGSPSETFAVNVIGVPGFNGSDGQLTLTVGHGGGGIASHSQRLTVTVVDVKAIQPQPSSTSTVTV
jgi:hypothetical protein